MYIVTYEDLYCFNEKKVFRSTCGMDYFRQISVCYTVYVHIGLSQRNTHTEKKKKHTGEGT